MTRIVQQYPTPATRSLARLTRAVLVALLFTTSAADAALTTGACLAQKRVAWSTLRKCQGSEEAKLLKGKSADLVQCQAKFQATLTKISAKATKAMIACRYRDNGDLTITDYDTGLQWEKLTEDGSLLDKDITFTWGNLSGCAFTGCPNGTAFVDLLGHFNNCVNTGGAPVGGFAGHCDWRLPTVVELQTILLAPYPCGTHPCVDPIFGPTVAGYYWSATTSADNPGFAWFVNFDNGNVDFDGKDNVGFVRAVRAGL
jgi:hypothetical protein